MKKAWFILIVLLAGCSVQPPDTADTRTAGNSSYSTSPVQLWYAETWTTYNLSYGRFGSLYILADVENLAYHKQVELHYSIDGAEWKSAPLEYAKGLDNNRERWSGLISLYQYSHNYPTNDIQFALKYIVNGVSYWDNNLSRDYHITCSRFKDGGAFPTFVLGKSRNIQMLHAAYTTNTAGKMVFTSAAVVKNLAYEKQVSVVYTSDNWKTVQTGAYVYQSTTPGGEEVWRADVVIADSYATAPASIEFAVSYDVSGQSYWDNNDGYNFIFYRYNSWIHGRN